MADAAPKTEKSESMEEILQSIKRIMDDNTETAAKPAEPDVYDLTNVVKEEAPMAEAPPLPKAPAPEPVAAAPVAVEPLPTTDPYPAATAPISEDGLMSRQAKTAAATAFKQIESGKKEASMPKIQSPQFRTGATIEELVLETLRPMLKAWLDENLPVIAQKIVEKEVKRIVQFHYDQG